MNEKLKNNTNDNEKNILHKHSHLIIIILSVITCILLIYQSININKVNRLLRDAKIIAMKDRMYKEYNNFQDSKFAEKMEKEEKRFKRNFKKTKNNSSKENINPNKEYARDEKGAFSFFTTERHDKEKGIFVVEIGVPEDINKDNINIELNNNVLEIGLSQTEEIKNGDSIIQNFIGFSRFFITPKTKANTEDIKYDINNGVLTAVVPII